MKVLDRNRSDWNLEAYFTYWEANRSIVAANVYTVITNKTLYYPEYKNSLHDAWIIGLQVAAIDPLKKIGDVGFFDGRLGLALLGAYHDRILRFAYTGVSDLIISNNADLMNLGDAIIHEFLLEDGRLVHSIEFDRGHLSVRFNDVNLAVEALDTWACHRLIQSRAAARQRIPIKDVPVFS